MSIKIKLDNAKNKTRTVYQLPNKRDFNVFDMDFLNAIQILQHIANIA